MTETYHMSTVEAYHKNISKVFPVPPLPEFIESLEEHGFEIIPDDEKNERDN